MEEIWKELPCPLNGYFVSSKGNILSSKRWRLLKNLSTTSGYLRINLGSKNRGLLIHRLVAMAFIGNPSEKLDVNHKDRNRTNNCIENLEWVTRSQNNLHAWNSDISRRENTKSSKLNWALVKRIREEKSKGRKQKEIAKEFHVSPTNICAILKNRRWPEESCPEI